MSQLLGRVRLTATMRVLTGLHIGAGKDTIEIGGIDNPIIKHPLTGDPYVPGSSLKGKLRFLLEWAFGTIRADGRPWGFNEDQELRCADPVLRIFGTPAKKEAWKGGPTRLIVRDATLDPVWRKRAADHLALTEEKTEEKTEVVIDRIAGKAHDIGPRHTERVPAGAAFEVEAVFRLFDWYDDGGACDHDCLNWLLQGFDLLEQDALGGSGSRGYGRVRFDNLTLIAPGERQHNLDNKFRQNAFDPRKPADIVPPLAELIAGRAG